MNLIHRSFLFCCTPVIALLLMFAAPSRGLSQGVGIPPSFTVQPTNQDVYADSTVTMQTAASGSAPLAYQWFWNGNILYDATNAVLTLNSVQTGYAVFLSGYPGSYVVVVSNNYGSITSAVALLTVRDVPPYSLIRQTSGEGPDRGTGIATDNAGNLYLIGTYSNALNFGDAKLSSAGGNDVFMAKYNRNGQLAWAKTVGGPGSDSGSAVAVDPFGFIYFSGSVTGLVTFDGVVWTNSTGRVGFMAKYTSAGSLLWVRTNPAAPHLAFDRAGNIYAPAPAPGFFDKYDTNGVLVYRQWATHTPSQVGQPYSFVSKSIAVDSATNVIVVASYYGSLSFTNYAQTNVTLTDIWTYRPPIAVVKFNPSGQAVWGRRLGGCYECILQDVYDVAVDSAGSAFVASSIGDHGVLFQYDRSGANQEDSPPATNLLARGYPNGNTGIGRRIQSVTIFQDTNLFIAGDFSGPLTAPHSAEPVRGYSAGADDGFVAHMDLHGNIVEAKGFGGATNDSALAMALDPDGNPCLTGYFRSLAFFGATNMGSFGPEEVFIARVQISIPPLKAALVNHQIRLSWSSYAGYFSVEGSDTVTGPYSKVTGQFGLTDTEHYVDLPLGTTKFFRLRRPW
ncbi:MAG: hypothetical protein JWM16_3116 [Verrucomicrobiales bacterium]|nr:hypothetical protein [Verrucomicrobiales bacterium]